MVKGQRKFTEGADESIIDEIQWGGEKTEERKALMGL